MKKMMFLLVSCLLMAFFPVTSYAEKKIYVDHSTTIDPSGPRRGPDLDFLTIIANQSTCELCLYFTDNVSDLELSLTKDGVTYEEDELDVVTGQNIIYCLENYAEGDYALTVKVGGVTLAVYTVTVEDE